ncbi:hypothetical protein [Thermomonas fusca]
MNSWKILWDSYYQGASKSAYAKELWRLSSGLTRALLVVSFLAVVLAVVYYVRYESTDWKAFPFLLLAEGALILVVDHMRGKRFSDSYGSADSTLSPAEREDHRANRYLIFRSRISGKGLGKSHVDDLFDVLDAKIELENHRNERLNRFLVFVSGFASALAIAWIRGLETQEIAFAISVAVVGTLLVGPILWLMPSRKERLKELKYFMKLFSKSYA